MSRTTLSSLVVGASSGLALTGVVVAAGALIGAWSRPSPLVLAAAVLATGLALGMPPPARAVPYRLGAAALIPLALAGELLTPEPGIGPVQGVGMAAGAMMAAVGPRMLRLACSEIPPVLRKAGPWMGLALVAVMLFRIAAGGGILGHDEAAYALKARSWLEGTPDTGWSLHRAPGMSVVAASVLPLSQEPVALRSVAIAFSLGTVAAVWWLGRLVGSARVGLLAAAVFAVAPSFFHRGAEFLTDLPAAGLLVVVAGLLWRWLAQSAPSDRDLYTAAAVGALAVYVRYQSVLSLGLLALAAVVTHPRHLRVRGIIGAAAIAVALLAPHLAYAVTVTGAPWGIVTLTAAAGGGAVPGGGISDYARDFPDLLAGQLGAAAMVAAVVWGWRSRGRDRQLAGFLLLPALGQLLVLGFVAPGEPRFAFFPVALLTVAGAKAAWDWADSLPAPRRRAGLAAVAVAALSSLAFHGVRMEINASSRAASLAPLAVAAEVIRAEAGAACEIVTGLEPQMTWLTGCATRPFPEDTADLVTAGNEVVYLVLAEGGPRQPQGEALAAYLALTEGDPTRIEGSGTLGDVTVWRVHPSGEARQRARRSSYTDRSRRDSTSQL